jgi:4-hydroxyphenylpyruvate dioxygenase-like putative hemolysin
MAYPTIDKTYGFKPVNRLDGLPYAGAIRQIPIAPAYATAILNGDTVQVNTSGYVVAASTTNSGNIVGVLVGCSYINSLSQPTFSQAYPAGTSTTGNMAMAFVVDDPSAAFRVCATVVGSTTPTAYTRAIVGSNVALVANVGSTTTGDSYYGIDGSSAETTNTLPIRVIDVIPDTATGSATNSATTYYEFLVKFNTAQYNNTTGV